MLARCAVLGCSRTTRWVNARGSMAPARQSVFGVRQPCWRASARRSPFAARAAHRHIQTGTQPPGSIALAPCRTLREPGSRIPKRQHRRSCKNRGSTAPARQKRAFFGVRQPCWRATHRVAACRCLPPSSAVGRLGALPGAAGAWLPHAKEHRFGPCLHTEMCGSTAPAQQHTAAQTYHSEDGPPERILACRRNCLIGLSIVSTDVCSGGRRSGRPHTSLPCT